MEPFKESLQGMIARVVKEESAIIPYDSRWTQIFEQERRHLMCCLPLERVKRIEHFGRTAIPGMSAKRIADVLVEVPTMQCRGQPGPAA